MWKGTWSGLDRRLRLCEKRQSCGALTEKNDSGGGSPAGSVSAGSGGAVRACHGPGAAGGRASERGRYRAALVRAPLKNVEATLVQFSYGSKERKSISV